MQDNSINIATAHNIVVNFELANVFSRASAWLIDVIIMGLFAWIILYVLSTSNFFLILFVITAISTYHLLFEIYNHGQSPGKMMLGLRVTTLHGTNPTAEELFTRWLFRLVDITFSAGALAMLFISTTAVRQRIGDIIASTTVVKTKNSDAISLSSINKLLEIKDVAYPGITQYSDKDMLLVKQAISRYRVNPNEANAQVIKTLYVQIKESLGIKENHKNKIEFLRDILQEYIVLTR